MSYERRKFDDAMISIERYVEELEEVRDDLEKRCDALVEEIDELKYELEVERERKKND